MTDPGKAAQHPDHDERKAHRVSTTWLSILQAASDVPTPLVVDEVLSTIVTHVLLQSMPFESFVQVGARSLEPLRVAAASFDPDQLAWFADDQDNAVAEEGLPAPRPRAQLRGHRGGRPTLAVICGGPRAADEDDVWSTSFDVVAVRTTGTTSTEPRCPAGWTPLFTVSSEAATLTVLASPHGQRWEPVADIANDAQDIALRRTLELLLDSGARARADRTIIDRSLRSVRGDFRSMAVEAHRAERSRMFDAMLDASDRPRHAPPLPATDPLLRALLRLKYRVGRSRAGEWLRPWYERRVGR